MTFRETMAALKAAGSAQTRSIYIRHGAGENTFGVKFADLKTFKSRIKTDHELARQLWASGNSDARILATMIADPNAANPEELDAWAGDVEAARSYGLADALVANFVAKSPHASTKMTQWIDSGAEYIAQAGWALLATLCTTGEAGADAALERYINRIEREIHSAPNRARHGMNNALIAIGVSSEALRPKVLAAAARIGKVEVDHGETGCKTPDVRAYIEKALSRAKTKKANA